MCYSEKLTQQQVIAWRTPEEDTKVMKGECKSIIVNAIKAFLQGDMPCALFMFHNAKEDEMCMFGGAHFHAVAYTV